MNFFPWKLEFILIPGGSLGLIYKAHHPREKKKERKKAITVISTQHEDEEVPRAAKAKPFKLHVSQSQFSRISTSRDNVEQPGRKSGAEHKQATVSCGLELGSRLLDAPILLLLRHPYEQFVPE